MSSSKRMNTMALKAPVPIFALGFSHHNGGIVWKFFSIFIVLTEIKRVQQHLWKSLFADM